MKHTIFATLIFLVLVLTACGAAEPTSVAPTVTPTLDATTSDQCNRGVPPLVGFVSVGTEHEFSVPDPGNIERLIRIHLSLTEKEGVVYLTENEEGDEIITEIYNPSSVHIIVAYSQAGVTYMYAVWCGELWVPSEDQSL